MTEQGSEPLPITGSGGIVVPLPPLDVDDEPPESSEGEEGTDGTST